MNDMYAIIYIILHVAPFSFLRYYPFLEKLRFSKFHTIIGYFILLLGEIVAYYINNHTIDVGITIVFHIIYMSYSLLVIRNNLFKQLFVILLISIYQMLIMGFARSCEQWLPVDLLLPQYLIADLLIILQLALTYNLFLKFIKEKLKSFIEYEQDAVWKWVWLIPGSILLILLITEHLNRDLTLLVILSRMLAVVCAFFSCVLLVQALEVVREKQRLENDLRVTEKLRKVQAHYYESLSENMAVTRKMKHDLRHQLFVLRNYLETGRLVDTLNYLQEYQKKWIKMRIVLYVPIFFLILCSSNGLMLHRAMGLRLMSNWRCRQICRLMILIYVF